MENSYSVEEILDAVEALQKTKKNKIKIAENKNITEIKKSDIPKNTLKLIEEAENSKI